MSKNLNEAMWKMNLHKLRTHKTQISNHAAFDKSIGDSKTSG